MSTETIPMLPREEPRGALGAGLLGAVVVHVAIVLAAVAQPARAAAAPPPVEVEIDAPEPPKETPPPPKEEPKPEPAPEPKVEPTPTAAPATPPPAAPPAAKAGALLTANDDAPKAKGEEPVSFVTDPNGGAYGSGVVQKGGTADVGQEGAKAGSVGTTPNAPPAPKAAPPAPKADALVAAADLSRPPKLAEADACKGYFPKSADDDAGDATLLVVVKPSGAVASATVIGESPAGQGFGSAARTCLLGKTFVPALDKAGAAVSTATKVHLRFSR